MDILLILYSIFLALFLISPFLYVQLTNNKKFLQDDEKSSLESERKMLLENLKDLKTEMDTKKIQAEEFSELSRDIIEDLKRIDTRLSSYSKVRVEGVCGKCNFHTNIPNAKFCAMCGTQLT